MKIYFEFGSAIFAVGAAALWLFASRIKTPKSIAINVPTIHIHSETVVGSQVLGGAIGETEDLEALAMALIKQSRWNSFAALSAAASAACQFVIYILQLNSKLKKSKIHRCTHKHPFHNRYNRIRHTW